MKKSANTGDRYAPAVLTAVLLILWELAPRLGWVREFTLPPPSAVLAAIPETLPLLPTHLTMTLTETGLGFCIAVALAAFCAVLMDLSPAVKRSLYPLLLVSQTVPLMAMAPLFALWFGLGLAPKVVIVVLICFFPIVVGLYDGLASSDPDLLNLMRTMNATPLQVYRHVKVPGAMNGFFSGLRIAATYSIMGAVIGEWMGGTAGLGIFMIRARSSFSTTRLFVAIMLVVALSLLFFALIDWIQNRAMPWSRSSD